MKTYFFCTYFDKNYSAKGLALYYSIRKNVESFRLFILCLDDATHEILSHLNLPSVELIRLKELESRDSELFATRETRSLIEYFFTITPAFILDVLTAHPEIDIISYIDADMFLFGSIIPVYDEMGDNSILIIEHRFPKGEEFREIYGRFNVGFLSFRQDNEGLACLKLWRRQCIEWCYDYVEGDKFADQKYLDAWPSLFTQLVILNHIGVNVAPWNVYNYSFHEEAEGEFFVDGFPLIIFHFHGLKEMFQLFKYRIYDMNLSNNKLKRKIRQIKGSENLIKIYRYYLSTYILCHKIIAEKFLYCNINQESIRVVTKKKKGIKIIQFIKKTMANCVYYRNRFQCQDFIFFWSK